MKNNLSTALFFTVALLCGTGYFAYRQRTQTLMNAFSEQGIIDSDFRFQKSASDLSGHSLVFYDVTHAAYPALSARRVQINHHKDFLHFSFQGVTADLPKYLSHTYPLDFKNRLEAFVLTTDLLLQPLLSWALLNPTPKGADILFSACRTAPNQISVTLIYQEQGRQIAQFAAKFSPYQSNTSVLKNLEQAPVLFQLVYLNPTWKSRLDDYALSKNQPFLTANTVFPFVFTKKK